jgi:peptidylprolyl isomerase
MKSALIFIAAILLSTTTSILVAQGQTKRGRAATAARGRRTKPAQPEGATATTAANSSPVATTPSGLIYVITRRSNGRQPRPGEKVVVHYTGILGNGVKFDSSLDRGQPFTFKIGVGQVIKGWDEGIAKLHVGEQATLIIPPQLAYGVGGAGGTIPPNATLIFVVELLGIEDVPVSN